MFLYIPVYIYIYMYMYMYRYVRICLHINTGQESARKLEQIKLKLGGGGNDGLAHKTALIHRVLSVWKEGTCAFLCVCVCHVQM